MSSQEASSPRSSPLSRMSSEVFNNFMTEIHPGVIAIAPSDTFTSSPPPIPGCRSSSSPCPIRGHSLDSVDIDPDSVSVIVRRPRTCFVYKHMPDPDAETKYYSKTNHQLEWRCRYCPKRYAVNGGTRLIKTHLKSIHEITEDSPRDIRARKRQVSIQDALVAGAANPQKRRRVRGDSIGITINADQLEVLTVNFITSCNLPLRLVECPSFRNLLAYLNPDIDTWLPEDHHTINNWIIRQYDFQKGKIKSRLQSAKSCIHLTIDLWTSGNDLALIGIIAHFVNQQGELEELLLCLKEVEGEHTGQNLSKYALDTIEEYGIASRLGYLQMDNAPNNDVMIRYISIGKLAVFIGTIVSNFGYRASSRI